MMNEKSVDVEVRAVQRWCAMWRNPDTGNWVYIADGINIVTFNTEEEALEAAKSGPDNPVSF